MLKKVSLVIALFTAFAFQSIAQEGNGGQCGWLEARDAYFEAHPGVKEEAELLEKDFNAFAETFNAATKMTPDTVIIPVVFHIIHNNGSENISDQACYDAITQLNLDYMANNSEIENVIDDFADIVGNPQIQFRLAQYDPDGNCTNGITRTVSEMTYTGGDNIKTLIQWPRNKYLNIWVSKVAEDFGDPSVVINGYAPFPSWVANDPGNDGLVIRSAVVGLGERTITHEIGHYLNLRHTWGNEEIETTCTGNDLVSDTPPTQGNFGGCNVNAISCGSLDNVQNYMEYSDCKIMYTVGQANRMIATLNSSTAQRNQLWLNDNLIETGVILDPVLCAAEFNADVIRICSGSEVEFTNLSYNGDTEWTWNFEGGDPSSSNEENPVVTYNSPGFYQVSLTISNGIDEITEVKDSYIHVLDDVGASTPVVEGFENATSLPNDDWTIYSSDEDRYWEVTDLASNSGNKSVVLKNYYQNDGNVDELESNPIDLTGMEEVAISFKYAYAKRYNANDDVLKLKVTRTCGQNWIVKETLKASDGTLVTAPNHSGYFTPESTEWEEAYVDNISSLYFIENFRFKFEFNSGNGNNIYLDDINIFDPTTVGINEVNKAALKYKVFPNPVENTLNISFNLLHNTEVQGDVYDISGRKVMTLFNRSFQIGVNTMQLNTADWNSGVYFVRIQLEGESFTEKILKH